MTTPTQAVREDGPWSVMADEKRVHLSSDDFTHDVLLQVKGDFESNEQRLAYAEEMCRRLNDNARLRAANAALTEALWGCIAAMERTQHIDEAGRIAAADAARVVLSSLEG